MRTSSRLSVAAAIAVIAATAACGSDSTGPPNGGGGDHTPGTLAQHLDTLYASAKASSVTDSNYKFRMQVLSDLELAAAYGAAPTSFTVTTASGTEQWNGFVFEEGMVDSASHLDSALFVVAYRDSLVHTAVISLVTNGAFVGSFLLANDTAQIGATSHAQSVSLVSTGASCATPIAGLVNPIIVTASQTSCLSATFNSAFTLGFPARTGVSSAFTSIAFANTTFAGERFLDATSAGSRRIGVSSLHQLLREIH